MALSCMGSLRARLGAVRPSSLAVAGGASATGTGREGGPGRYDAGRAGRRFGGTAFDGEGRYA